MGCRWNARQSSSRPSAPGCRAKNFDGGPNAAAESARLLKLRQLYDAVVWPDGARMVNITRRRLLAISTGASLFPWRGIGRTRESRANERLWYLQPASQWNEALPLGNGRLGCMLFGRVAQERLQLNEDTLWSGAPYTPDNPQAFAAIPEVRRLLQEERFEEATALASAKVMARPLAQMAYGSLGDLLLNFPEAQVPAQYERSLDLRNAIATVRYRTAAGTFLREAFVSSPHQVVVCRMQALKSQLTFNLSYRGPRKVQYVSADYQGSATSLAANEPTDWLLVEPEEMSTTQFQLRDAEPGSLLIVGPNAAGADTAAGLTFALYVRIVSDGTVLVQNGQIFVRNARTAILFVSAATSYLSYDNVRGDPVDRVRQRMDSAARATYETLKRAHINEYSSLYSPVKLDLPPTAAANEPTDIRVAHAETTDDPSLAALYFQFARYLLISSSRPGCQPANLQGIWNEGINPPWGSKYTININTQMNYWPADAAGLAPCVEPLLRMVEELAVTGSRTANAMYGARGWVAHHNTDLWRAAAPIDGPLWGLWPCGGAWLCNALWDHYDYSRDAGTLRRIYPLLRGAALFFLDTLVEDPKGRGLVTSPSLSPENRHPFGSSLCIGPAMDRQIVRDLFQHTLDAGRRLQVDEALLAQIQETARRLAPDAIGRSGQLQEWLEDWDDLAPEPHHRHVSHLYAVYPSSQINVRDTPELSEAARISLRRRGDLATGWGTAWRLCLWSRLGEGEHAHAILKSLLGPRRTYPNLFDAHPPFQIDGNFGGAAGILEMLMQSWGNEIRLLPALPSKWASGEVRGLCARGAIGVSFGWRAHRLSWVELTGSPQQSIRLLYPGGSRSVVLDNRGSYRLKK